MTSSLIFGDLDATEACWDTAQVAIYSVPFEKTVSYAAGTAQAPRAILEASAQVELYDEQATKAKAAGNPPEDSEE